MPTYLYLCPDCEASSYEFFRIADRPETIKCLVCQGTAEYRIDAPNVVGKGSYLDGHKRKGWANLKEAARLNKEAAGSRSDTKKEIQKEIKRLGVGVTK